MERHIILVGPMGSGKTTIGRLLAEELALPFKDIDHLVEEKTGASVSWIFDKEGEAGFRKREHQVLKEALQDSPAVIATGGGIVMNLENRQMLKRCNNVVFLYAPVDLQLKRTKKDKSRPLLQNDDPKKVLTELMAIREPWYKEIADVTVETGKQAPKDIVERIIAACKLI